MTSPLSSNQMPAKGIGLSIPNVDPNALASNAPDMSDSDGNSDSADQADSSQNGYANPLDTLNQADQDLQNTQGQGITQDQLKALEQHEGSNAIVNMFMNMVGAVGRVNPQPFTNVVNQESQNEKNNLILQDMVANRGLQRAQAEQNIGLGQIKGNQALQQYQFNTAPASTIQHATILALAKQAGITPEQLNMPQNMNSMQAENYIDQLSKPAQFNTEMQRYQMMLGARGSWKPDPKTGQLIWAPPLIGGSAGQTLPGQSNPSQNIPSNALKIDQNGGPQSSINIPSQDQSQSQQTQKPVTYNDLSSGNNSYSPMQQKEAVKQIGSLSQNYMKEYGQPNVEFQQSSQQLGDYLNGFTKGNFVQARQIPTEEARLLGGFTGKLSNYDIGLQKDPVARGLLTDLQSRINGMLGRGNMTPQEARYIQQTVDDVTKIHNQNMTAAQNMYRTKAKQVAPGFNDDAYLFGGAYNNQAQQQAQSASSIPSSSQKYMSLQDLLKSRGQ